MFRVVRSYSIATFAAIALAFVATVVVNRTLMIRAVEHIAESSNVAMAQVALDPIREDLAGYLARVGTVPGPEAAALPLPEDVRNAIDELMRHSLVKKVKVYNAHGVVSYSTDAAERGSLRADNGGFLAAMAGRVVVKLIYRDTFNAFDHQTEDDNVVQSYIPVRARPTEPVLGVFEVYHDVDPLVHQAERMEVTALAATLGILVLLYGAVWLFMRRAQRLIDHQGRTIRETSAMLQALSQDSLHREEHERKRLATDLHEGLAQTLSAVKMAVEASGHSRERPGERDARLRSVIPELQYAIRQVRAIVMELRPPSLDDLGLVRTLQAMLATFAEEHPTIRLESRLDAHEADVPPALKIVVYRVAEAALRAVGTRPAGNLNFVLHASPEIVFEMADDGGQASGSAEAEAAIAEMRQRTVMSGGHISVADDEEGLFVRVAWRL